jgi:hypothetical protein
MPAARRFRIGSATVVFATASGAWFAFVWSTMVAMLPKMVTDPGPQAIRYSAIATAPMMIIITAIAFISVNVSQSEGASWLYAGIALPATAIGFVLWLSRYVLAAA